MIRLENDVAFDMDKWMKRVELAATKFSNGDISKEKYESIANEPKNYSKRLQSEIDKARGSLKVNMETIKNEFGCESIEEAIKLGKRMGLELEELKKEIKIEYDEYKKEWGDNPILEDI